MHKLILRQLKRHRGIGSEAEIPSEWLPLFSAVSDAYEQADRDLELMERSLEISSEELTERNSKLSTALEDLKNLQGQLVHSAKMAGLGELVAGVSHEINTPAGAILNAIEEVRSAHKIMLPALSSVIQELETHRHADFLRACEIAASSHAELSTVEVRNIAQALEAELKPLEITNARTTYRNLANIGFNQESVGVLKHLLATPQSESICRALIALGTSQLHVRNIQIAIGRIIHLIKALRLYTHAGKEALVQSDLAQDIQTTLVILNNKLKHGVSVIKEFEEIPRINCYADQLNQVWTNLINNAADAMNGRGQIVIRLRNLTSVKVCVEIEDNGPGIDPSVKDQLFTPYVTTKPKGDGTGLGLSICKEIILKHKGSIGFESKPGRTVFRVVLPIDLAVMGGQE